MQFVGYPNCPSGYDESSSECGATRKLLELPVGIFAALACVAAGVSACLIFCLVGLVRRRKKHVDPKHSVPTTNGTYTLPTSNNHHHSTDTYKKDSLFFNEDYSWHPVLQPVEYIHVLDRETTVWPQDNYFLCTSERKQKKQSHHNQHRNVVLENIYYVVTSLVTLSATL